MSVFIYNQFERPMLIKVLCAVVSAWLVAGAAAGETDSPAGVALVQVDAKRINAVQMHAQPYDGQDLMEIEERGNAQSRHSLRHSHRSRHSHLKPPRRLSRSRCHRYKERAAAPSRRSPHHLLVAVEKPPKSQSLSPCVKCTKKNHKCQEQKCRRLEKERRHQKNIEIKKPKGKSLDKQVKLTPQTREQQNQAKLLKELHHLKNKVRKLQRKLRKKHKSLGKEDKPVKEVIIREKEEPAMTKKVEPVILPLMERLVSLTKQQQTPAAVETSCCSLNTQTAPKDSSPVCESCEHAASTDCCATDRPSICSSDMKNSSVKNPSSISSPTDHQPSESSSPATVPSQSSSSDTLSGFFSSGNSSINSPSTDSPSTDSTSTNSSQNICTIRDDSTTNSLIE